MLLTQKQLIVLLCFLFYTLLALSQNENKGLDNLSFMLGEWKVLTQQKLRNKSKINESGNAKIEFILKETYLQLKVDLSNDNNSRNYLQLISYDKNQDVFISQYLYSGSIMKVYEEGSWNNAEKTLTMNGVNPWADELDKGINIISSIKKIHNNKFTLSVNEFRDEKWEIGYESTFIR